MKSALTNEASRKKMLHLQRNELTESEIYFSLSKMCKDEKNAAILNQIGRDEIAHSNTWKSYTKTDVTPNRFKVMIYSFIGRILGFTFVVKHMELSEAKTQRIYAAMVEDIPEASKIIANEKQHENALIAMLDEERLQYLGSIVLGLNDALVELTGTLAGLTFALQNNKIVALSGIITGVSATLSMAASEFLSARAEGRADALKSSIYTGIAYLITVILLVFPYIALPTHMYKQSLALMMVMVILIISGFNYYVSIARELPFVKRFAEMAGISIGVALLSFVIGLIAKRILGIDVM